MEDAASFAALARLGLPFFEYARDFCGLAAATALEDATLNLLFWLGANYHRPVDLPDTIGLSWREGVFQCLGNVRSESELAFCPPGKNACRRSGLSTARCPRGNHGRRLRLTQACRLQGNSGCRLQLTQPAVHREDKVTVCDSLKPAPAPSSPPAAADSSPEHTPMPAPRKRLGPPRILDSAVQCPPLQGPFLWCPPLQSARLNQPLLPPINSFVGDSGAPAEEAGVGLEPRFRRQFRHSLPNLRIRHGRPRFPLHFGSQNGRHPGGLLSPVTMVKLWCSKTMVYLWSPWFNNRNPFSILKPWLIFVKEVHKLTVPQLQ